jgi:hypothetical protein
MVLEERDARGKIPFEATDARCGERGGLEVEVPGQLGLPLLHEVRRAKHGEAVDLAAVPQFTCDEPGLDGLSDTDVIGDEEPNGGLPEGHQERDQLVGPRLDGDVGKRPEGSGPGPELELQGVS